MRRNQPRRLSNFAAGALALVVTIAVVYFGFTKAIPFQHHFTISATFPTSNNLMPKSPVRIAGVNVGKVVEVSHLRAGEPGAVVKMQIDDKGLPIHKDATFAMPPLTTWYTPRETIVTWARESSLSGAWRWRAVPTSANAQPALAFYAWDGPAGAYLPFALNVLSLQDRLVRDVTAFIVRSIDAADAEAYVRFPEQPMDPRRLAGTFERFGLPEHLS